MSQKKMTYTIAVSGIDGIVILGDSEVVIDSGVVKTIPIRLQIDPIELKSSSTTITFTAQALDDPSIIAGSESRFLGPLSGF